MAFLFAKLLLLSVVTQPFLSETPVNNSIVDDYIEPTIPPEELDWYDDNIQIQFFHPHLRDEEEDETVGQSKEEESEVQMVQLNSSQLLNATEMPNSTESEGILVRIKRNPILILMKVKQVIDVMIQMYELYKNIEALYLKAVEIHNKTMTYYNQWVDRYKRLNRTGGVGSKYGLHASYLTTLDERKPASRAHRLLIGFQKRKVITLTDDVDPTLESVTEYMRVTLICPGVLDDVDKLAAKRQVPTYNVEFYNGTDPVRYPVFQLDSKIGTFGINPALRYDTGYYSCYKGADFAGHVNLEVFSYGEAELIGAYNFAIIAVATAILGFIYHSTQVLLWCFCYRTASNGWYIRPRPRRKQKKRENIPDPDLLEKIVQYAMEVDENEAENEGENEAEEENPENAKDKDKSERIGLYKKENIRKMVGKLPMMSQMG